MDAKKNQVHIEGVGTHQIDFRIIDEATKSRVIDCIQKHGKISVMVGGGVAGGRAASGFEQLID